MPMIQRILRTHLTFAVLVASFTITWLARHWTTDYEETPTIAYSLGKAGENTIGVGEEYRQGEFSWFGIAHYDLKQGLGVRLPTQGSWSQNPLGFLRHLIGLESLVLARLYISLVVTVWIVSFCITKFAGSFVLARRVGASIIIASIAPSFFGDAAIGYMDWSSAVVFNWSVIAIFTSLITTFHLRNTGGIFVGVKLVAGVSTLNLITEHPGWLPMATVFLGSSWLVLMAYQKFKLRLTTFSVGLSAIAIVNPIVIYLDIRNSIKGVPQSAISQGLTPGTLAADSGYLGFAKGALPWEIEYVLAQVLRLSLMPLLSLMQPLISRTDAGWNLLNDIPSRRAFLGLSALVLVIFIHGWRSDRTVFRISYAALIALAVTFAYAICQDLNLIPTSTKTSGSWLVSRGVAGSACVLLLVLLGRRPSKFNRTVRAIIAFNISLFLISALSLFGIIPAINNSVLSVHPSTPERVIGWRNKELESTILSLKLLSAKSLMFVGSSDITPMELLKSDFSVVAPLFPKVRPVAPIATVPNLVGLYTAPNFDLRDQYFRRVLNFLNIDTVGVRTEDELTCSGARDNELRLSCKGTIRFDDSFDVYRTKTFSTFTSRGVELKSVSCALLETNCPVFEKAVENLARQRPRLSLCKDSCLAQFEYEIDDNNDDEWLLLPIRYDSTLRIRSLRLGNSVRATNNGGFVSVSTQDVERTGTLEVTVAPDSLMIARTILAYLNLGFLVALMSMIMLSRLNRFCPFARPMSPGHFG